jgi:short-subunit dehydrogenase
MRSGTPAAPASGPMSSAHRPIGEQVVVVTGASQGIGRATTLLFASRGASVVAVARNEEALASLAADIAGSGGTAEPVLADVADAAQVVMAAQTAVDRFGRIDTWVNNAAVSVYAEVEALEPDEMERVVAVNLLGVMYGSRAAIPHLRRAGGGTIVNVGSALSDRAVPLQSAYVASKHGVAGFSESLRLELALDRSGIDVVLIMPSSMNTPLFRFARSKVGRQPMPVPPVYDPNVTAEAIVHAAEHGGREIVVGGWGKALTVAQMVSPSLLDRYMLNGARAWRDQLTGRPDDARDNLFEASSGSGSVTGDFGRDAKATSLYTTHVELYPERRRAIKALLVGAVLAAVRRVGR